MTMIKTYLESLFTSCHLLNGNVSVVLIHKIHDNTRKTTHKRLIKLLRRLIMSNDSFDRLIVIGNDLLCNYCVDETTFDV